MFREKESENLCFATCMTVVFFAIGGALLGGASQMSCGLTLETYKIISEQRVGIVYNSSVHEVAGLGSVVNYVFDNYLTVSTAKKLRSDVILNDTCFLTVYNGPVYSIGQANLLSVNDTITTNFKRDVGECYLVPQKESCENEQTLTNGGIVFLSLGSFFPVIFCCYFTFVSCVIYCREKKKSKPANLSSV